MLGYLNLNAPSLKDTQCSPSPASIFHFIERQMASFKLAYNHVPAVASIPSEHRDILSRHFGASGSVKVQVLATSQGSITIQTSPSPKLYIFQSVANCITVEFS